MYENSAVVVINKPAGLMVHADGRDKHKTLVDWIIRHYPKMIGVGEEFVFESKGKKKIFPRPGIVHRLDKDTSGVLVLCKTDSSFRKMKAQFKNHTLKKVYRALVWGHVKHDTGIIDSPIARSKSDFRIRTTPDPFDEDTRGVERAATTRYKVLERLYVTAEDVKTPVTYIELYPTTGRTHQLRVHCRSIRHPIIDDPLYGPEGKPVLVGRTALHAVKIVFVNPESEHPDTLTVEAQMPQDFLSALANLTKM